MLLYDFEKQDTGVKSILDILLEGVVSMENSEISEREKKVFQTGIRRFFLL